MTKAKRSTKARARGTPKNSVVLVGKSSFTIKDEVGEAAVCQFRRPDGTPTFLEVFGKGRPELRSMGENMLIIRAWMHLKGHAPIREKVSPPSFANIAARFLLPRHSWPHFDNVRGASAFLAEWGGKLVDEVAKMGSAKDQPIFPGWAVPECAALYVRDSIVQEATFGAARAPKIHRTKARKGK